MNTVERILVGKKEPPKATQIRPEGNGSLNAVILSDSDRIQGLIESGFDVDSLQPTSYDLRAGMKALKGGTADEQPLSSVSSITMEPGSYVAVMSAEKVKLPDNVCAIIGAKRKISYEGIILLTGMQVHPGYEGFFVFGLFNASGKNYLLQFEQKVCTVTFFEVPHIPHDKIPKQDKFLARGDFDPEFKRLFAEFKTQGWIGLENTLTTLSVDFDSLRADLKSLKDRIEDIHEPIRQLTEQVQAVTRDVATVNESVNKTDQNLTRLSEKHSDLVKEVAARTGKNTVWTAIVLLVLGAALATGGKMVVDHFTGTPTPVANPK